MLYKPVFPIDVGQQWDSAVTVLNGSDAKRRSGLQNLLWSMPYLQSHPLSSASGAPLPPVWKKTQTWQFDVFHLQLVD